MKKKIFILILLSFYSINTFYSQVIYNAYANVTNISGNTFTVANVNETNHTFATGEQVVIIQMQDNVIGTNTTNVVSFGDIANAQSVGLYEIRVITSLTRTSGTLTTVTFSAGLNNTYNINSNSRVQIITFRRLSTTAFTTSANITGAAWDGTVGGVIALEVGTDLTLAHNISADGIGFRGGASTTNYSAVPCLAASNTVYIANDGQQGFKGEGIYRTSTNNFNNCRGKILNGGGGGNNHNSGGGGGGNYEQGGLGGKGWDGSASGCTLNPGGGLGGISLKNLLSSRVFMGGGGGGGQQNDGQGSPGANGGGIVFIKANRIITSGSCGSARVISANGATSANSGQDGAGGGGAGGTMVFLVNSYSVVGTCSVNINVNGGNGSTANDPATHGGGGAGGQGYVVFSTPTPTTNVLVSANNGTAGCNNNSSPCTSFAGSASGSNGGGIQPNGGSSCANSNLLVNPSFEFSVVPNAHANNLVGVSSWGGWKIPSGNNFNIIKTDGTLYSGGPNNAQDGTQYAEIESAAGDMDQKFRVPCPSTLNFSGYFSSREQAGAGYANWTASIQIVNSTGSVMGTSSTKSFVNADGAEDQIWYQVSGTLAVAAGDYTFRARMGDFGNFDNAFLCATSCNLLPIELIDFTATYYSQNEQVALLWKTASEKNSSYFSVERSEDASNWQEIQRVKAAKNSSIQKSYSITDNIKLEKIMYYRLKSVDQDDSYEYFKTVLVKPNSLEEEIEVYPNPSKGGLTIHSNKVIKRIEVINCFGIVIKDFEINDLNFYFNLENKGIYYIKVYFENSIQFRKVIIE